MMSAAAHDEMLHGGCTEKSCAAILSACAVCETCVPLRHCHTGDYAHYVALLGEFR